MSEPFIGEIRTFPYTYAPAGWMSCDGQYLQIGQYSTLYAIIGTIYGGDGRTDFRLPPLNASAAMGNGTGPALPYSRQGYTYGASEITLQPSQLPKHTHTARAEQDLSDTDAPTGSYVSIFQTPAGPGVPVYKEKDDSTQIVDMNQSALATAGATQSHYNMQPYLPLRFCIAIIGIFPSRS